MSSNAHPPPPGRVIAGEFIFRGEPVDTSGEVRARRAQVALFAFDGSACVPSLVAFSFDEQGSPSVDETCARFAPWHVVAAGLVGGVGVS